jgi:uncharacterized protein
MYKNILIISLAMLMFAININVVSEAKEQMTFGTMSPTGGYMLLATGIAKIVNENVPEVNLTPVPEPRGSQGNIEAIHSREREFGLAQNNTVIDGITTRPPFESKQDFQGWFSAHYAQLWPVATESSGIQTFKDFEGKKVSIGAPGSNDEFLAVNVFLPLAGVDIEKVDLVKVTFNESINLLKDGHIDAMLFTAAPKLATISDLAFSRKVRYITMDEATIEKVIEEYPEFHTREYDKDDFVSNMIIDQLKTTVMCMNHIAIISPEVDAELVYQMTRAVFEHLDVIHEIAPVYRVITLENALVGMVADVHPGAMRYYKEVGIAE